MMKFLVLSALVAVATCQFMQQEGLSLTRNSDLVERLLMTLREMAEFLIRDPLQEYDQEPIQPYNFEYNIPVGDHNGFGQMSRQESKDESGRVVGSYTINDPDGRQRIVNYIADESGFRATIQTNEPGTKSESSADVNIVSSAADPFAAILANGQRLAQ